MQSGAPCLAACLIEGGQGLIRMSFQINLGETTCFYKSPSRKVDRREAIHLS